MKLSLIYLFLLIPLVLNGEKKAMKPHLEHLIELWTNSANFVSEEYFISAKESAPLNYYREAAYHVLKQYDPQTEPPIKVKEDVFWFTEPSSGSTLEKTFKNLKINWVPKGNEYALYLLIFLDADSPRPKSFDDLSPFFSNWKEGYSMSLDLVANNRRLEVPLRWETSPGHNVAECRLQIPKNLLEHICITLSLTNKNGHMVEGVDIMPLELIPKE